MCILLLSDEVFYRRVLGLSAYTAELSRPALV